MRYLAIAASAGVLASCAGAGGAPTQMANTSLQQTGFQAAALKRPLLYVGGNNDKVTVYTYPAGKLVNTITNYNFNAPTGYCTDHFGDVFISNIQSAQIFEYSAGGRSLLSTIKVPSQYPDSCSVDAGSGDLAVASLGFNQPGNLAVYRNAEGAPRLYGDGTLARYWYCAYDNQGNLYVDGQDRNDDFKIAELEAGSHKLRLLKLDHAIGWPGTVEWLNGKLTVEDRDDNTIYTFAINGKAGVLTTTTTLGSTASKDIGPTWIVGDQVVGVEHGVGSVQYWPYPKGGAPTKTISEGVSGPDGLTVTIPKQAGR